MNIKMILVAIILVGSTIVIASCAHYGYDQTGKEVISDSTITASVKSALLREKNIDSLAISVETYEGVVQLSGFVESQWQVDQAGMVAGTVIGIKSVKNNLIYKPK